MVVTGRIVLTETTLAGDTLLEDHAAGAGELLLENATDFNETVGTLMLIDDSDGESTDPITQTIDWVSSDEDTDTIVLDGVLNHDFLAGTEVRIIPASPLTLTYVETDDELEPLQVEVPQALVAMYAEQLADREWDPDTGPTVLVEEVGETFVARDIVQSTPKLNGSIIDPESTIPVDALTDGLPPASSPTPRTQGGLNAIFVRWDGIVNPDLVKYQLHMHESNPTFVPVWDDPATLAVETASNLVSIKALPNGDDLSYGAYDTADPPNFVKKVYYFSLIAGDADGAADPSDVVEGTKDQTASGDLAAESITADKLEAVLALVSTLQVGSLIEVSPPGQTGVSPNIRLTGGITVKNPADPDGEPLVRLHPMGCLFRGRMVTDILTVMQDLQVQGTASLTSGASMHIDNGVATPTAAPELTAGPATSVWPALPYGYSERGISWDPDGISAGVGCWLRLLSPTAGTLEDTVRIQKVSSVGAVLASTTLTGYGPANGVSGLVRAGSYWYINVNKVGGGGWEVARFNASTGVIGAFNLASSVSAYWDGRPAISYDGTQILVAGIIGDAGQLYVDTYALSGLVYGTQYGGTVPALPSLNLTYVGLSLYDFGTYRLMIGSGTAMRSYTISGTTISADPTKDFTIIASALVGGIGWNGANFFSTHGASVLNRYSNYYPTTGEKFWVKYVDSDGTNTTAASPVKDTAVPARRYLTATLRPAPTGVTTSRVYVGYGTTLPGTFYRRPGSEALTGRSWTMLAGKDTTGSTSVPATNTMGGTPARVYDDFGGSWKGSGEFKMPKALQSGKTTTVAPSGANVDTTIAVTFSTTMQAIPDVSVTPYSVQTNATFLRWWVTNVTTSGFTINFSRANTTATGFHWTAIAM